MTLNFNSLSTLKNTFNVCAFVCFFFFQLPLPKTFSIKFIIELCVFIIKWANWFACCCCWGFLYRANLLKTDKWVLLNIIYLWICIYYIWLCISRRTVAHRYYEIMRFISFEFIDNEAKAKAKQNSGVN